jgi:hypothetical protein
MHFQERPLSQVEDQVEQAREQHQRLRIWPGPPVRPDTRLQPFGAAGSSLRRRGRQRAP